jgi:hypothetical protein
MARANARVRARRAGSRTPISKSWQFGAVGGMLACHPDGPIYAQLTIAGITLRWRLETQNRTEAEAFVKPAVDARARVREAARAWRECPAGHPMAKTALANLLREQRRFRDALLAIGAKRSKGWAEVDKALTEPPFDETSKPDPDGARRWIVEALLKYRDPPEGRSVTSLLAEVREKFHIGKHAARSAFQFAQGKTGNRNWSTKGGRPRGSAS